MLTIFFIIILSVVLIILFKSTYKYDRKKALENKLKEESLIFTEIPWWKGIIYFISLAFIFIVILLYFTLKDDLNINIGIIETAIVLGLFFFLYSKVKKIRIKKRVGSFSFYFAEEHKKEDWLLCFK